MTQSDIEWAQHEMAKWIVIELLGVDRDRFDLSREAMLVNDLGADSLDLINIQEAVEDRGCEAPDDAFHWGMTIGDLANLIKVDAGINNEPV